MLLADLESRDDSGEGRIVADDLPEDHDMHAGRCTATGAKLAAAPTVDVDRETFVIQDFLDILDGQAMLRDVGDVPAKYFKTSRCLGFF